MVNKVIESTSEILENVSIWEILENHVWILGNWINREGMNCVFSVRIEMFVFVDNPVFFYQIFCVWFSLL